MEKTKSKLYALKKIMFACSLALVLSLSFSMNVYAGDTRGGTSQEDSHDNDGSKLINDYTNGGGSGGYGGKITIEYNFYGGVSYNGKSTDLSGRSIYYNSFRQGSMTTFSQYSAVDEIRNAGKLYDFANGSLSELHNHLYSDTGIGASAASWGDGTVAIGSNGLYASIIMTISLTGSGSTIGDHVCGNSLRLGYEMVGGSMQPTADLAAILNSSKPELINTEGALMIGKGTLKLYANKVSYVTFTQSLITGGTPLTGDPAGPAFDPNSLNQYIYYSPTSNYWTNDKYYVYAGMSIPIHTVLSNFPYASLTLHNCTCASMAVDGTCSHSIGTQSPCNTWGLDAGCQGHIVITYGPDAELKTVFTYNKKGKVTGSTQVLEPIMHVNTVYCTTGISDSIDQTPILWDQTYRETCDLCGGLNLYSNCGNHDHPGQGSAPYDWSQGRQTVSVMTNPGGAVSGYDTSQARFTIENTSDHLGHSLYVKFKAIADNIWDGSHNAATLNRPVDNNHQAWYVPDSSPFYAEKTSGPYYYDGVNPNVTITTTGFAIGGTTNNTKNFNDGATVNGNATKETVGFSISASDAHSGFNTDRSYVKVTTAANQYLAGENDFRTYDYYDTLYEEEDFNLPNSGIYGVTIHVSDKANQGSSGIDYVSGRNSDDGIPNEYDVNYTVTVDKIAPQIKIGYPEKFVAYNGNQSRYETSASENPYFWLKITDDDNWHGITTGLNLSKTKYLISNTLVAGDTISSNPNAKTLTAAEEGAWIKVNINGNYLEKGKDVYLIVYAEDNVGNRSYTTTVKMPKEYMDELTAGDSELSYVGPNNQNATNTRERIIPAGHNFVNRSNVYYQGQYGGNNTTLNNENSGKKVPLEITRVYDVKWETGTANSIISWNNRVPGSQFATYRNKQNDMIGLGYRVNFAYHLIGYGLDSGDKTNVTFELYGKKGTTYNKLKVYDENGNAVDESSLLTRTFISNGNLANDTMDANSENSMGTKDCIYRKEAGKADEFVCYFNISIPATYKFKFADGSSSGYYTGSEVLVKLNCKSTKYMDPSGSILAYNLNEDATIPWAGVGTGNRFYGSSKIVGLNGSSSNGEAFWYDVDNTALVDITGQKSH